jgi:RNA polymerase sigma factor (sigma-70 family)
MSAPSMETSTPVDTGDQGTAASVVVDLDVALDVFLAQRTRLFRVAYRVIGDVASAEDVVQEAWLRWQRTDRRVIKNPAAFLTTTTTHLAINVIQSARYRHEAPIESPVTDMVDSRQDPTQYAEQTVAVEEMLMALMGKLTPAELAAYLLRKGFDYPYGEIAALLRTSSANARQLLRRAQQRVEGDRERPVDEASYERLVDAFLTAARTGELAYLEGLLARDAKATMQQHPRPPARRVHRLAIPKVA